MTLNSNRFLLSALAAALGWTLAGQATAQTFTILHSFSGPPLGTNTDGAGPAAGLVLYGNTLYGTAQYGGTGNSGTIFKINIDGSDFTNLHNFTADGPPDYANSDGANPSGLVLSGNALYGTTSQGGGFGKGTIFKVNTDGSGFTRLYSFTGGADGAVPAAGLILSGSTLYGTASQGGEYAEGTVFKVNTNGMNFTNLYSFTEETLCESCFSFTNSDGAYPAATLLLSGNTLYGTAERGGSYGDGNDGCGTLFSINTDTMAFTVLQSFTGGLAGNNPAGALILSGNTLYGTTSAVEGDGYGSVFSVNTDGGDFTTVYAFFDPSHPDDGAIPFGNLVMAGNTLYGTASLGGSGGNGTVFRVNTDGTGYVGVHDFSPIDFNGTNSDGAYPEAGLILSGNTLYGTTSQGGTGGNGTLFSLSLGAVSQPLLTLNISGANVVLTWPTNSVGIILQSTTNLAAMNWSTVSPQPVPVNGQYTATNPISGRQQFFRLVNP